MYGYKITFFYALILTILTISSCKKEKLTKLCIADDNWYLMLDTSVEWRNDPYFFPGEEEWVNIPVYAPSLGWKMLDSREAFRVNLPSTVEAVCCTDVSATACTVFQRQDPVLHTYYQQVNYAGVSWWWTEVTLPEYFMDDSVTLNLQSIGARTEVFLDSLLVGYCCHSGQVLTADLTSLVSAGNTYRLHVRITSDHRMLLTPGYQGGAGLNDGVCMYGIQR